MQVLIIDDDVFGMAPFKELIEDDGHKVDFAGDAAIAAEKLASSDYDAVILDIMLPYRDALLRRQTESGYSSGLAILRELRLGSYGRNADTRVIIYTARELTDGLLACAREQGVSIDAIYSKPGRALEILLALTPQTD